MQLHEFYARYANTPLSTRSIPLLNTKDGILTLDEAYHKIMDFELAIRTLKKHQQDLLELAEPALIPK